jgi:hypothetical protein
MAWENIHSEDFEISKVDSVLVMKPRMTAVMCVQSTDGPVDVVEV